VSNGVRFIRVHGHVVPIREGGSAHPKVKQASIGSAVAGAGVGIGAVAGTVSANMQREAAGHQNVYFGVKSAFKQGLKDSTISAKTLSKTHRLAAKNRQAASALLKTASKVEKYGSHVGAAVIGVGVHQALKDTKLNEPEKAAIGSAAGIGAHFGIRSAYHFTFSAPGAKSLRKSAFHAIKRISVRGFKL
jgi:hypothetical protein